MYQALRPWFGFEAIVRAEPIAQGMELEDLGPAMAPLELHEDGTPKSHWPVRQVRLYREGEGLLPRESIVMVWLDDKGAWHVTPWFAERLPLMLGAVPKRTGWMIDPELVKAAARRPGPSPAARPSGSTSASS